MPPARGIIFVGQYLLFAKNYDTIKNCTEWRCALSDFFLTPADKQSALWKKLLKHFQEQLDTERKANDGSLDEKATAKVRGRISKLKELIALDGSKQPEEDAE